MKLDEAYILAYIKKDLSDATCKECDMLMESSPEFRECVQHIQYIYDLSENLKKQKEIDTVAAWNSLTRKITFATFRLKLWRITRTTAAILLPLFLLFQYAIYPLISPTLMGTTTLVSPPGIITKTILPDGSEVWLRSQSKLTYPNNFGSRERTVQLSGEAFFKVKSDPKHRFNVEMPDELTISAYGTEFNISAYPEANRYEVVLVNGNVEAEVNKTKETQILSVNHQILFDKQTSQMSVEPVDAYAVTAWKDGMMVFRRKKLEYIAREISNKFGVVIQIEDETLKDYEYTATFKNETLEDILELLKKSAPISYSISDPEQLDNNTFTRRIITIKDRNKK